MTDRFHVVSKTQNKIRRKWSLCSHSFSKLFSMESVAKTDDISFGTIAESARSLSPQKFLKSNFAQEVLRVGTFPSQLTIFKRIYSNGLAS